MQINELKSQNHLDIKNIKNNNLNIAEQYELEIRKLKEVISRQENELTNCSMRVTKINKETTFEIDKLREEKDRFKN